MSLPYEEQIKRDLKRQAPPPAMPAGITAATLKGTVFKPIAWVVADFIAEGLTMLASKPKVGKSWWMLDVGVAVARGGYTLDRHCVEGDVLYCALEDNLRRLKSRMGKVCPLGDWPPRLTFWTEMLPLEDGGLEQLRGWIAGAEKPRLIIIDVFGKVRRPKGATEGVYDADYLSANSLKKLSDETGVAIVIVHHLRKAAADGDPFDMVSGSTGLTGAMDTVLVLHRGSDGEVTLYGRGRDIPEVESAVRFDKQTCRWSLLGDAREVRISAERRAIIEALRAECDPLGPNVIADVTGQTRVGTRQLLRKMLFDGEVRRVGRGKYALSDINPDNNDNKVTLREVG